MTGIELWNKTAGSNNASPPFGAPEGMPASQVNDTMRQMMAATREWYESGGWTDLGLTVVYSSSTAFGVVGDQRTYFMVGRRIKLVGTGAMGTLYGTITAVSYSSSTIVTVALDSGTIDVTLQKVYVSFLEQSCLSHLLPLAGGTMTGALTVPDATITDEGVIHKLRVTNYITGYAAGTINSPGSLMITGVESRLLFVRGSIANHEFSEFVNCQSFEGKTQFGTAKIGTPPARTYTDVDGATQLTLSGGTNGAYSISVLSFI